MFDKNWKYDFEIDEGIAYESESNIKFDEDNIDIFKKCIEILILGRNNKISGIEIKEGMNEITKMTFDIDEDSNLFAIYIYSGSTYLSTIKEGSIFPIWDQVLRSMKIDTILK